MLIEPHDSERHGLTPPNSCLVLHNAKKKEAIISLVLEKRPFFNYQGVELSFFHRLGGINWCLGYYSVHRCNVIAGMIILSMTTL